MASTERTLAVLSSTPINKQYHSQALQLLAADFDLLKQEVRDGEDLEEAGLDLGLGVGEEERTEDELVHTILVLQRTDAVYKLKELVSSSFVFFSSFLLRERADLSFTD
jgi:hypothetical protein